MFMVEFMELVELTPLRDALIGLPVVTGISTEQRKRLTIGVELVPNPSIIFMDEPNSRLDAHVAAIVMRTVRNIVNTGRTVVCTIHQPSIDIFEAFDDVNSNTLMINLCDVKQKAYFYVSLFVLMKGKGCNWLAARIRQCSTYSIVAKFSILMVC